MKNIELRGKRAELIKQATEIVDGAHAEGRSLSAEEKVKFDKMEADAQAIMSEIDVIERTAEMKKELAAKSEAREAAPKATRMGAFEKYLRNGMGALNSEERKIMGELRGTSTQVVGTDSLGGFIVPQDFSNELDMAVEFTGEVERLAKKLNTGAAASSASALVPSMSERKPPTHRTTGPSPSTCFRASRAPSGRSRYSMSGARIAGSSRHGLQTLIARPGPGSEVGIAWPPPPQSPRRPESCSSAPTASATV